MVAFVSDYDVDDDDDGLGKGEGIENTGQVDHDDGLGQGEGKMKERQEDSGAPRGSRPLTCPREARILGDIAQAEQGSFVYFFLGTFFPHELLYICSMEYIIPQKILIMLHAH